jgi:hypothetical protein
MIYALLQQDLPDNDHLAIAEAIRDCDSLTIDRYVSLKAIIHAMDAFEVTDLYCIFCRIPVLTIEQGQSYCHHASRCGCV